MIVRDGCCKGLCAPVVVTDNLDLAFVTGEWSRVRNERTNNEKKATDKQ
jgi:hypothetical protein